jgi:hypothetical protein
MSLKLTERNLKAVLAIQKYRTEVVLLLLLTLHDGHAVDGWACQQQQEGKAVPAAAAAAGQQQQQAGQPLCDPLRACAAVQ